MNKTALQLANETMEYINKTMKNTDILELTINCHIDIYKYTKLCNILNEKLKGFDLGYFHKYLKNGNLLIYKYNLESESFHKRFN